MKIKVHNPAKLPLIDYRTLKPLQGDLKEFREREFNKLKSSIEKFGFIVPFFIWFPTADPNTPYILDGHGRHKLCVALKVTPYELPYVRIDAVDVEEARQKLLVITSQMQRITQEGLYEFTLDMDPAFLINMTSFAGVFNFEADETFAPNLDPVAEAKVVTADDMDEADIGIDKGISSQLEVTCPHCGEDFRIHNGYV